MLIFIGHGHQNATATQIPVPGLNEVKAHEHESDEVYTNVNEELERDVQRKDHSKHGIGITRFFLFLSMLHFKKLRP